MRLTKKQIFIVLIICFLFLGILIITLSQKEIPDHNNMKIKNNNSSYFELPDPVLKGEISLEEAISERRSIRKYTNEPITLEEVSQLLWSAQGITNPEREFRAAPSAGALYPLSIYIAVEDVENIESGLYQYSVNKHGLKVVKKENIKEKLFQNALYQTPVRNAPLVIIISANYEITKAKYGERAQRYVHMEAGHAAQNIYLQATTLKLGTVVIGAFNDQGIKKIIGLEKEDPLYLMPIGR